MEKGLPQTVKWKYEVPPVISIVSKSKSGKTTVVARLAQEFGEVFFPNNAGTRLEIS
jgi:guanylate kinase